MDLFDLNKLSDRDMSLYCQMKPVCGFNVTPTGPMPADCQCSAQDSGRDGPHVQGDHPLGNSAHRGGGDLPLCVDQWRPKLSLEGHLGGGVPALGGSSAAGQGQRHPADASFRYDGLQLTLGCCLSSPGNARGKGNFKCYSECTVMHSRDSRRSTF